VHQPGAILATKAHYLKTNATRKRALEENKEKSKELVRLKASLISGQTQAATSDQGIALQGAAHTVHYVQHTQAQSVTSPRQGPEAAVPVLSAAQPAANPAVQHPQQTQLGCNSEQGQSNGSFKQSSTAQPQAQPRGVVFAESVNQPGTTGLGIPEQRVQHNGLHAQMPTSPKQAPQARSQVSSSPTSGTLNRQSQLPSAITRKRQSDHEDGPPQTMTKRLKDQSHENSLVLQRHAPELSEASSLPDGNPS
jgi:hypothetical protein